MRRPRWSSSAPGGALETRGEVEVWVRTDLSDTPTLTITGENTGAFLGSQVVSGYDHDGDGIADVLVTAQLDSRIATNAGAAFVFLSAAGLSGEIPVSEADIEFTTTYAGALLAVTSIGDERSRRAARHRGPCRGYV